MTRDIAGCFRFLIVIQCGDRPARAGLCLSMPSPLAALGSKHHLASVNHAQITGDLLRGLIAAHAIGEAPGAVVRHQDATVLKHVQEGA